LAFWLSKKHVGAASLTAEQASLESRSNLLTRMFHELMSRDRTDGRATGYPQGFGPEAYLNGTSQGAIPEDARKDAHICGRSRQFMKYPG
jgi:hypothetical protein